MSFFMTDGDDPCNEFMPFPEGEHPKNGSPQSRELSRSAILEFGPPWTTAATTSLKMISPVDLRMRQPRPSVVRSHEALPTMSVS